MKLEKARTLLEIQDLTVFNRQKLSRYLDAFNCCLDWICINPPGTCAVDLRYSECNNSEKTDVRFFTTGSNGLSPLVPGYARSYKLSTNHRSENIYFTLGHNLLWNKEDKDWRLAIDWQPIRPGGSPAVYLEQVVDLSVFGLAMTDRFYITELK